MEESVADVEALPVSEGAPTSVEVALAGHQARRLSNGQLLKDILRTGSLLVTKEIELARAEVRADIEAEIAMVKLLAGGAVAVLLGLNLLLVAAVFALAAVMPGWLAALVLAAIMLALGAVLGILGWRRRVSRPLAATRDAVAEDLRWAKGRLA
jgi:putative superfamily III holin-X